MREPIGESWTMRGVRGVRAWRLMEELRTDVRYGVRWLTRSPGFAAAAILSLGLGIGANTAVFSLLDAVLLKSLPVAQPRFARRHVLRDRPSGGWRRADPSLHVSHVRGAAPAGRHALPRRGVGAVRRERGSGEASAAEGGGAKATPSVQGQMVSGNYYTLLGVTAAAGRLIATDDDRAPGAQARWRC